MKSIGTLTLWATVVHRCLGFSVTGSNDANVLANALFSGPGITIVQASFSGAAVSSGTFTDGPFGIGSGAILTSGSAVGALPNGDHYVNNGQPGSDTYCNVNTFNAAILTVDVVVGVGYNGIDFEYIMASEEEGGSADPIGIFVGGTQYAKDQNGNRITATSPWLAQPLVIVPPNSLTSYPGSSPPFLRSVLVTGAQTIVIAICDQGDAEWDSGLLIKAGGCTDCDPDFRLAYVTTTVTTTTTGTSTQPASGTVSGTIFVSVMAETTTTTAEETTTTVPETTTTTAETTTAETTTTTAETTTEETTTTTAETTTEETTTTTAETTTETTTAETMTTAEMTTTEETTTTAETTTETTTSEELTTTTEEKTTTTEEPTTTTTEVTTTAEESTTTTEESSTTLEITTETATSVGTTTETSTELATTETTTELPTASDEVTSTEESTTETTSTQLTETTTSLTTQPTTSTESLTSTELSTTSVEASASLQSSAIWSTQSSDTTSQLPTTSIEPSSITLDSTSIWSSEPSYTTTQESTLESSSTQTSSIILQLSSDELLSTEILSSTNAQFPTVMSVESSTTLPTTSTETSPRTSTQLLPVMSTETSSTTGTGGSTSEVIPPASSSLEPSIPTLEQTTSDSMFTVLPTPAPPSESTTSTEPIDVSSVETLSPELSLSETVTTVAPLPSSASTASETSTEAAAASNLPSIEDYEFVGCLGSRQSYPTFEELLTDPEMTTARCIELAVGRKYVGLYFRSCYVADELTDTGLVQNGQCDLPCPGDPGLFCGGNAVDRRRAVPSDRLLTLYALTQALDSSSIEVMPSTSEPLIPSSLAPSLPPTSTLDIVPSFDPSSIDIPSSVPPSDETSANNLPIPFPTQGPSPPKGYTFNVTQTVEATYASTVTTVVYQTINPQDPEYLTVTEVVVTIGYYPCGRCAVQPIPPVEMTTIVQPCKACGWQGANSVTLTIPKAACTSAAGEGDSYQPGAWRRPAPHKAADGVHWSAEAEATEPASRPGNQYSPPGGNGRYPAEYNQQRPVATHQTQPAMTKKPAPDASLPPPSPAKAESVNPGVPTDSEPTQTKDYVWDDQDEYDSPQPPTSHTQAAPKPVGGSHNSNLPTGNNPWGPLTESIDMVAKGAVNGINGFMMATLVLLVIFQ
ncbi:hypothetical protein LCI18_010574 [Fusarium solani-melongenae]|uniref:Uncharacterized protein n=1 Tax=Fusarium solani subsp. cucurbitae TaxID=2747967 RepID=A0ACD3ZE76_FUSSC|nr:hypothetical protein LCI18_010574 [Fusarium solani-melongenae]